MSAVANSMNRPAEITETVAAAPAKKAGSKRMIGLGLLVLALSGAAGWYIKHHGLESTDDAQLDGDLVSIPARTSGVVTAVHFVENQVVKKGDLLAEIDGDPSRARLAQAEAALDVARASADAADAEERIAESDAHGNHSVAEATLRGATSSARATKDQIAEGEAQVAVSKAQLSKTQSDLDRAKKLLETNAIPQAQLDLAQTQYDAANASLAQADAHLLSLRASTTQALSHVDEASARVRQTGNVGALIDQARARARAARAQVATAQAARDLAALDLTYTKIVAPEDGVVSKK